VAAEIPLTSAPDRQFEIVLGDVLLTLRSYWNASRPGWFLDVFDAADQPLARGLALVPGVNLFSSLPQLTRTVGQLRMLTSDGGDVPTDDGLGVIGRLYWFAPEEFETLAPMSTINVTALPFVLSDLYHG